MGIWKVRSENGQKDWKIKINVCIIFQKET